MILLDLTKQYLNKTQPGQSRRRRAPQWILTFFGAKDDFGKWPSPEALASSLLGRQSQLPQLVKRRQRLLCDAWLTDIGHLRPGISKGLSIDEAIEKANELEALARDMVKDRK